jgi:hypothetical protein
MDDHRATLIAVVSSLARLQLRLLKLSHTQRERGGKILSGAAANWNISDLQPPSAWFDAAQPNTALSGAISSVALVQQQLLEIIESRGPVDGIFACRVLEHLCHPSSDWSALVLRFAVHLGVELPLTPRDLHNGSELRQHLIERRGATRRITAGAAVEP